jgi:hypothetical protein
MRQAFDKYRYSAANMEIHASVSAPDTKGRFRLGPYRDTQTDTHIAKNPAILRRTTDTPTDTKPIHVSRIAPFLSLERANDTGRYPLRGWAAYARLST